MLEFIVELLLVIRALGQRSLNLWRTGNLIARLAVILLVSFMYIPLILALAFGNPAITALSVLISLLVLGIFLLCRIPPLAAAIGLGFKTGQEVFQWIFSVLGLELATGIYFVFIPVRNNPALVPLLLLVFYALVFLGLGTPLKISKIISSFLFVIGIGITIAFFFNPRNIGGSEKSMQQSKAEVEAAEVSEKATSVRKPLRPVLNQPFVITLQPGEETEDYVKRPQGANWYDVKPTGRTKVVPYYQGDKGYIDGPGINPLIMINEGPNGQLFKLKNLEDKPIEVVLTFRYVKK